MIATTDHEKMHIPKLSVLGASANLVEQEMLIESGRFVTHNEKEGIGKKGAIIVPKKKETKATNKEQNPNVRN